jgi:ACS family sodium-dependent inorganic phosphate cotransporter
MPSAERLLMYGMLSATSLNNLAIRFGLPAIVFFMQREYGWAPAEVAGVLGSFFPGYIATQVPSGWFAQKFGGVGILTVNMVGNAALLCLIPAAAAAGRGYLRLCFCAMGLFQGPLIPAQGAIKAEWLRGLGAERAFALRVMGLGSKLAATVTGAAVPFIATRAGWRVVAYVYGGCTLCFAAAWHCLASNAPRSSSSAAAPPPNAGAEKEGAVAAGSAGAVAGRSRAQPAAATKAVAEWGVLRVRAAQATVWGHIADNFMIYMMNQMGPVIFTEVCGVSAGRLGGFLAIPPTVNSIGSFVVAGAEAVLLQRGLTPLRIQKMMTISGAVVQALSLVWFGRCRRAVPAVLAWCGVTVGHLLHGSGFFTNYEDVGGPDSAILWSVGNPLASLPGYVAPLLAAAIRSATGRYNHLFNLAASLQLSVAVFFGCCGSTTPARQLLAMQRQKSAAAAAAAAAAQGGEVKRT